MCPFRIIVDAGGGVKAAIYRFSEQVSITSLRENALYYLKPRTLLAPASILTIPCDGMFPIRLLSLDL